MMPSPNQADQTGRAFQQIDTTLHDDVSQSTPLSEAFDRIDQAADSLGGRVASLTTHLTPILSSPLVSEVSLERKPARGESELVGTLNSIAGRIETQLAHLEELQQRLEL